MYVNTMKHLTKRQGIIDYFYFKHLRYAALFKMCVFFLFQLSFHRKNSFSASNSQQKLISFRNIVRLLERT
jgi:hypothetical protein